MSKICRITSDGFHPGICTWYLYLFPTRLKSHFSVDWLHQLRKSATLICMLDRQKMSWMQMQASNWVVPVWTSIQSIWRAQHLVRCIDRYSRSCMMKAHLKLTVLIVSSPIDFRETSAYSVLTTTNPYCDHILFDHLRNLVNPKFQSTNVFIRGMFFSVTVYSWIRAYHFFVNLPSV